MSAEQQQPAKPRYKHNEGVSHHIVTFILSLVLTALAFFAVLFTDKKFAVPFMVGLAIIQVLFQLFYWMHLNQKGHRGPMIGIATGAFVTLTAIVMALYWVWW
ncbi:cytochrome C oxidase subunit IV family protein [Brevibacillus ginsengisoli]|uniref:cytochrome C oxidase subunit IV family protein n=1 Tax=Brevibacillus ginsengisoli TaxID=363854 RepID=UPI003CF3FF38